MANGHSPDCDPRAGHMGKVHTQQPARDHANKQGKSGTADGGKRAPRHTKPM